MAHMVIYRGADGKPGYHQTDEIHDAIGYVERIRNQEGVEHARIFRLEEVVFEYQPYFRVQLSDASAAELTDGELDVSDDEQVAVDLDDGSEGGDELADTVNGSRRGLFGR